MFNILLVDDDSVDVMTLQRAFSKHKVMNKAKLDVVSGGNEALAYLNQVSEYPNLILLDINMPGMGGIDFLEKIRSNPKLENLRILVLTTSSDNNDVQKAHSKCIIGYVTKSNAGNCTELTELVYNYCKLTVH